MCVYVRWCVCDGVWLCVSCMTVCVMCVGVMLCVVVCDVLCVCGGWCMLLPCQFSQFLFVCKWFFLAFIKDNFIKLYLHTIKFMV